MPSKDSPLTTRERPEISQRADDKDLQPRGHRAVPGVTTPIGEWVDDEWVDDTGLTDALSDVEDADAAARLDRFMADAELVTQLQLVEFGLATPEWREFAGMLTEYGYGVFVGWGLTGLLREKALAHGRGGVRGAVRIPESLRLSRDEANDLALDLMLDSIPRFRTKTLMNPDIDRRWSAHGGTSLKSFFIGRALMDLPDVWERHALHERRARGMIDQRRWIPQGGPAYLDDDAPAPTNLIDSRHEVDPSRSVITRLELDEIFVDDALIRVMHELRQMDYSIGEIVELLNAAGHRATVPSVKSAMSRLNGKVRKGGRS